MVDVAHSTLTGADLHEPKGVAAASSGQVYIANGAGSGVWTTPDVPVFMSKHISGLIWQNAAGDPTNDITVVAGAARDASNTEDLLLAASLTKRLDANWAVGDNQGGLDAGSIANTTYHIWLIKRTDTDVVDVLFSTSASSPTMPTNYTKKRRIGSFVRVSAAIILQTVVETSGGGIHCNYTTPVQNSGVTCTNTGTLMTLARLPTGVIFKPQVQWVANGISSAYGAGITSAQTAITDISATYMHSVSTYDAGGTLSFTAGGVADVYSNTSAQIKGYNSTTDEIFPMVLGFEDPRRD